MDTMKKVAIEQITSLKSEDALNCILQILLLNNVGQKMPTTKELADFIASKQAV